MKSEKTNVRIYKNKISFWPIFLIIVLAGLLRIFNLGKEDLWYDEISSIHQATANLSALFSKFHLSPLYYLFLKYWIRLFGVSEFFLRLPSVIFAVASVYLTYRIGKRLCDEWVGLISGFFLAISPFHLFYSQEARHYSLFLCLTLLSILSFLKLLENKYNPAKTYILYAISTILLLYTHIFGLFILIIQNIVFLLKRPEEKGKWLISQLLIIIVFLLWLVPFIVFLFSEKEYVNACINWIPKPNIHSLPDVFKAFSYGGQHYGGNDIKIEPNELSFSKSLFYIFGFLFILGSVTFKKQNYKNLIFVNAWLFIPILVVFAFSYLLLPLFMPRYFIFVMPAYYILVAGGIRVIKNNTIQILLIYIIIVFFMPALYLYYKKDHKMRWAQACEYIAKNEKEGNLIIVSPAHLTQMFCYYGVDGIKNQPIKSRFKIDIINDLGINMIKGGFIYSKGRNKLIGIADYNQFIELLQSGALKGNNGFWLILTRWTETPKQIKGCADEYFYMKGEKDFPGVNLYYYR